MACRALIGMISIAAISCGQASGVDAGGSDPGADAYVSDLSSWVDNASAELSSGDTVADLAGDPATDQSGPDAADVLPEDSGPDGSDVTGIRPTGLLQAELMPAGMTASAGDLLVTIVLTGWLEGGRSVTPDGMFVFEAGFEP